MKAVVLLALLIAVAGCGGSDESKTFTVYGKMTLGADGVYAGGKGDVMDPCTGANGYDDIADGAQVVVRDAHGTTVGVGKLGRGILTKKVGRFTSAPCMFIFAIEPVKVTKGSDFYSVEVAGRGQIQFQKADAEDLELTLG